MELQALLKERCATLPDRESPGGVLGTIRKPSTRRGAPALFHGVLSYGVKVVEFQSYF